VLREKINDILQNSEKLLEYFYHTSSSINQRSNKNIFLQISFVETLERLINQSSSIKTLADLEEILLFLHKL